MKVREQHETIQKGKERVGEVAHNWPIRPNPQLRKQDRQRSLHSQYIFGTCFFIVSTIESRQPINVPRIRMLGLQRAST